MIDPSAPEYQNFAHQIWNMAKREATDSRYYRDMIRRRYRDPKGYIPHKEAMLQLMLPLVTAQDVGNPNLLGRGASRSLIMLAHAAWRQKAPSYWLTPELLETFLHCDVPPQIPDLQQIIPIGILFVPPGLKTPEGEPVRWLVFIHYLAGERLESVELGQFVYDDDLNPPDRLAWAIVTKSTTCYSSLIYLNDPEATADRFIIEGVTSDVGDRQFKQNVDSLLVQSLLAVQIIPELLESGKPVGFQSTSQSRQPRKGEVKWLNPNWIGKNYRSPRQTSTPQGGNHASPITHWRKGHYRRVVVGKREDGQRKWVLIPPTLVNAGVDR